MILLKDVLKRQSFLLPTKIQTCYRDDIYLSAYKNKETPRNSQLTEESIVAELFSSRIFF